MGAFIIQGGSGSFEASTDPRLGIVAAQIKVWAPDLQSAVNNPAPDIGIPIPEWNPRKISRGVAGEVEGYYVTIGYEGHPDPDKAEEYFEVEGSTSEDPIETHWNLQVLKNIYKGATDSSGHVTWPQTLPSKSSKNVYRNPMGGVEAWRRPGLIWNHNWVSVGFDPSPIHTLGTITAPPGEPPALSGSRNWLCIRVRGKRRGNVWQMQTSYELSGPYGWVPEMYSYLN